MAVSAASRRLRCALGDVELFSAARPGKQRNEDLVEALGSAAWLLDGASSTGNREASPDHDAAWYVDRLSQALVTQLDSTRTDLREGLARAIAIVLSEHSHECTRASAGHGPSATAVVARVRNGALDYLVLGDSSLLVETYDGTVHHHSDKRLGAVASELRKEILRHLRDGGGYDAAAHRQRVDELRSRERAVRNRPEGFWVASDDPDAAFHAITGSYDLGDGPNSARRIALVSDGLERAVTHLAIYPSRPHLLKALFKHGIPACIAAVREAEANDPLGVRYPRTAPADDASAITCDLAC